MRIAERISGVIAEAPTVFYTGSMRVVADLHIHSRFSRATGKKINPAYLDRWGRIKGIGLLGAGDCTHPKWLGELREQLDEVEPGFYTLKDEVRRAFDSGAALAEGLPTPESSACRFVLTGEISTIYKKGDMTRKVHHLIILPDFKAAAAFQARLDRVGNIISDGRPILGVDSRDLLGMLLDTDERALLVPAHIWTPWFSALGAKSGFDSIEACYGDLVDHIPATETGLSSNPPMNWALSALDRFAIISNSDAHSPEKLGREATVFEMTLGFEGLREALWARGGGSGGRPGIIETIEFFPQEGKYHYDGHRKCGVYLSPGAYTGDSMCPVCGKALTRGVMGRVLELADKPVDERARCPNEPGDSNRRPYRSLIPLRELLGELLETGPGSKKVDAAYGSLIEQAGSEFAILADMGAEDIGKLRCPGIPGELLVDALSRMRAGEVAVTPGYDGEYGVIRVFQAGEKVQARGKREGTELFGADEGGPGTVKAGNSPAGNGLAWEKELAGTELGIEPVREIAGTELEKPVLSDDRVRSPMPPTPDSMISSRTYRALSPRPASPPYRSAPLLDAAQEAAVAYDGPQAIIIAGPGTGKTAVLTARIARLVKAGVNPASILALSFTVKAAAELRERITAAVGKDAAAAITAATFHSLCCAILREELHPKGRKRDPETAETGTTKLPPDTFTVLGDADRAEILEELIAASPRKRGINAEALGRYIEGRKRFLLLPGERRPRFPASPSPFAAQLPQLAEFFGAGDPVPGMEERYGHYRLRLREKGALDFDDLPAGVVRLFAGNPAVLAKYRARYRYILVDEYQDVNFAQYALIRLLAPNDDEAATEQAESQPPELQRSSQELRVIGDPNQAIYGFRGSDKRFIDRFTQAPSLRTEGPADYPHARQFHLTRSFRCAAPVIDAAGTLIDTQLDGVNAPVTLFRAEYPTDKSEAEGIARRISRLIGGTSFFAIDSNDVDRDTVKANNIRSKTNTDTVFSNELTSLGECAVLLRTAAMSAPIVKALRDHGLPFELTGERPWWEDEPVKTLLAKLREEAAEILPSAEVLPSAETRSPAEAVQAAWDMMEQTGSPKKARKNSKTGRLKSVGLKSLRVNNHHQRWWLEWWSLQGALKPSLFYRFPFIPNLMLGKISTLSAYVNSLLNIHLFHLSCFSYGIAIST
ncbi:DNA helicase [Spirochaetia bacterium]|nr:DNA helicase [Spirochaetia bacterium]